MELITALEAEDPSEVGPYRIVGRLGAGGMGRVYLGLSRGGRSLAVKVVHPELARDQGFRSRFAREVAAARRVNGLFTAGVVDADPEGVPAWLATVYVPGLSLAEAVAEFGVLPEPSAAALGAGLAEALGAIHDAGVVHRDLKPSNVLLAADGPRVIDFGISVAADASVLTRTGTVVGTPGFMSPEQLNGQRVGPASDVFSLGAVLTYAAGGTGPFGTGSLQGLLFRIVHEEPVLDGVPEALRAVIERCLAKEPAQRPSVPSLLDELAELSTPSRAAESGGVDWLPEDLAQTVRTRASAPPAPPTPTTTTELPRNRAESAAQTVAPNAIQIVPATTAPAAPAHSTSVPSVTPATSSDRLTRRGGWVFTLGIASWAAMVGIYFAWPDDTISTDSPASASPTPSISSAQSTYPGTEEGFRQLAEDARGAHAEDLILSLRPTTADYETVFVPSFAAKAENTYDSWLWSNPPNALEADPEQTEVGVWKATTDDIKAWSSEVDANFPGGYEDIGPYLNEGITIYRWKYLEPGQTLGMAYDGMAYVNHHWVIFPKPWRVLDQ